jgi:hypothetical protein
VQWLPAVAQSGLQPVIPSFPSKLSQHSAQIALTNCRSLHPHPWQSHAPKDFYATVNGKGDSSSWLLRTQASPQQLQQSIPLWNRCEVSDRISCVNSRAKCTQCLQGSCLAFAPCGTTFPNLRAQRVGVARPPLPGSCWQGGGSTRCYQGPR